MLGVLLCEAEQQRPGGCARTRCADRAVPLAAAGAFRCLPENDHQDTRNNNKPELVELRSGMSPGSWATAIAARRRRPAGGDGGGRRRCMQRSTCSTVHYHHNRSSCPRPLIARPAQPLKCPAERQGRTAASQRIQELGESSSSRPQASSSCCERGGS